MARHRPAALALAALVVTLGGCTATHAGTTSTWHSPGKGNSVGAQPIRAVAPAGSPSSTKRPPAPGPSASPTAGPSVSASSGTAGSGPAGARTGTGSDAVALTFDDGPDANSMAVLDLLAEYHVKATFCVIGRQVAAGADVIRRIVADGHTLCNHTWDHDIQLKTRTEDEIRSEMQRTNDAIHAVVPGVPVKYFRNPGGEFSDQTVSIATSLGMASIFWRVDPQDWRKPPSQAIISTVIGRTGPGAIVLMHDGGGDRSATVTALRTILPNLAGRFHLIALPT